MTSILEGVRVVELGVWVAGPAVGGVMADWGADIIKVEPPAGDPFRWLFKTLGYRPDIPNAPFALDNRGKRSVVLDLRDEAARGDLDRLLGTADVFVTNLRLDALGRLGLDPDAVTARHPRLVYASMSGYGLAGPDRNRAAYDVGAFWARTGVAAQLVPPGVPPPGIRGGLGDHTAALALLAGTLAALRRRDQTGEGGIVETSLMATGIYCLGWDLGIQSVLGKVAPASPRESSPTPLVNSSGAADDRWFFLIGLEADRHFPGVARAIDRPDLIDDERFSSARGRLKNRSELIAIFDAVFATRTRAEWAARFDAEDVWWQPVQLPAEVVDDEQADAIGAFVDVERADGSPSFRAAA